MGTVCEADENPQGRPNGTKFGSCEYAPKPYRAIQSAVYSGKRFVCATQTDWQASSIADALNSAYR